MSGENPVYYNDVPKLVDDIIKKFDKKILFGMPIALGKSYHIANEMYRRAKEDPSIELTLVTALSLEKPVWTSDLERRMLEPVVGRLWKGLPDFDYMIDLRNGGLPSNVIMKEFYFKAGSVKGDAGAQQNHYSSNYTHVGRDIMSGEDENILYCHTVAKKVIDGKIYYSDSSNADLSLDIKRYRAEAETIGKKVLHVCHVNNDLPFMYGDAVSPEEEYDMILEGSEFNFPLFCVPKAPVTTADHMIGVHVSSLIRDGGSLQIGIGSLGDAIAAALIMRNKNNQYYNEMLDALGISEKYSKLIEKIGGTDVLSKGLYGTTEMLVDAFIELYKAGVIKRKVYDDIEVQKLVNQGQLEEKLTPESLRTLLAEERFNPIMKEAEFESLKNVGIFKEDLSYDDYHIVNGENKYSADLRDQANVDSIIENCTGETLKNGVICHGGFFIGPTQFYDDLRNMSEEERKLFSMTGVYVVNQLYGGEELRTHQRKDARFVNTGMKISILGNICSDALEDGTIISGVGGQYDFVAQGHALKGARVIMMIKSVRESKQGPKSNVVFNYGYTTIPRHLKDIVVTEYGIAELRGKVDHEVVAALINIADSRFQNELLEQAKKAKKLPSNYTIPEQYRNNFPDQLAKKLDHFKKMDKGFFEVFPFGTDFTREEIILGRALREFKAKVDKDKIGAIKGLAGQLFKKAPKEAAPYLKRMQLDSPVSVKERITQKIVTYALVNSGQI